jgi:hypothetical protein
MKLYDIKPRKPHILIMTPKSAAVAISGGTSPQAYKLLRDSLQIYRSTYDDDIFYLMADVEELAAEIGKEHPICFAPATPQPPGPEVPHRWAFRYRPK